MDQAALISAFVTLFVVVDPIGLAPLFIALTKGVDAAQRRAVALRAAGIAAALLTLFGLAGEAVLGFVGISMPAFRIAGGLLLFLTALDMLFDRRARRRKDQRAEFNDPSVFPLATPLIAGPGSLATIVLLAGQAESTGALIATLLIMAAVIAVVLAFFLAANPLERALGETGTNVVTRLLGLLLASLSVQFVLDGLTGAGIVAAP